MRLYPKSGEEAARLKEDYEFLGYTAYIEGDALVVVTKQRKRKKDKKNDAKKNSRRVDKRRDN